MNKKKPRKTKEKEIKKEKRNTFVLIRKRRTGNKLFPRKNGSKKREKISTL